MVYYIPTNADIGWHSEVEGRVQGVELETCSQTCGLDPVVVALDLLRVRILNEPDGIALAGAVLAMRVPTRA
jgi:hypothetical protein